MQPSSPPCISTTFPSSQTATLYSLYNSLPSPLPSTSAAAAAKSLQSCPTLCDPIDSSPSGSPSLGFSRQEYWSGLPLPSPLNPWQPLFYFLSLLNISCNWAYTLFILLYLVHFTQYNVFKVHPCYSMCQNFLPFSG